MDKHLFMPVILPLIVGAELFLISQIGAESETVRTLVAYEVIINAVPFFVGHAIFSAYILWKRVAHTKQIFLLFLATQIFTSLTKVIWLSTGSYIDEGITIISGCHVLLMVTAFGLAWVIWLTYSSLKEG